MLKKVFLVTRNKVTNAYVTINRESKTPLLPMKQNYTSTVVEQSTEKKHSRARRSGLRKESIELVRQFARAYTAVPGFPGFIAN